MQDALISLSVSGLQAASAVNEVHVACIQASGVGHASCSCVTPEDAASPMLLLACMQWLHHVLGSAQTV